MLDIAKSRAVWYTVKYNMKEASARANAEIFPKNRFASHLFGHAANPVD